MRKKKLKQRAVLVRTRQAYRRVALRIRDVDLLTRRDQVRDRVLVAVFARSEEGVVLLLLRRVVLRLAEALTTLPHRWFWGFGWGDFLLCGVERTALVWAWALVQALIQVRGALETWSDHLAKRRGC